MCLHTPPKQKRKYQKGPRKNNYSPIFLPVGLGSYIIVPGTSAWSGTLSYSSPILFLAQVVRRAALLSVLQRYKQERCGGKRHVESIADETYPPASALKMTSTGASSGSIDDGNESDPSAANGSGVGLETEEENVLTSELHQCIIAMISVPGISPGDVFFELYRTVVYLHVNDLKEQHQRTGGRKGPPKLQADSETCDVISKPLEIRVPISVESLTGNFETAVLSGTSYLLRGILYPVYPGPWQVLRSNKQTIIIMSSTALAPLLKLSHNSLTSSFPKQQCRPSGRPSRTLTTISQTAAP